MTALPLPWLAGSRSLGCVIVHVRADERAGGQAGHVVILEAETTALSAGLGSSQSLKLRQFQCLPQCLLPAQPFHSSFSVPQTAAPPLLAKISSTHICAYGPVAKAVHRSRAGLRVCLQAWAAGRRRVGPARAGAPYHRHTQLKRRGGGGGQADACSASCGDADNTNE